MRTVIRVQLVHDTGQECEAEVRSDSEHPGHAGQDPVEFLYHAAGQAYEALIELHGHTHAPIRPEDDPATVVGWNGAGASVEAARG